MNEDEIRAAVLDAIAEIAPEADVTELDPEKTFALELDLDSMDVLNVAMGIEERTGVEIPERDYARVGTVDALVAYLSEALARRSPAAS
ncbi:MAG: acyl carrier protein [Actinomycetota bacterium]|jgi:acyl carrier protein